MTGKSMTIRLCNGLWILLLALGGCNGREQAVALGTLERDRITLSATTSEVITALPVAQGSQVKAGMVLVQLDSTQQQAQVARAQAEVAEAEANLDKLRNGARKEEVASAQARVEGARAALAESELSYQRLQNLTSRKLASKADLDRALAQRKQNLATLNSAEQNLRELTNGTRVEDLRMGEANLEGRQAALLSEQKKLADLTIVATRDGILDNLPWNLGERVAAGSPLAVVMAGASPFARVYVPEPARVQIKVGDSLQVRVDGVSDAYTGQLRWIASEPAFTPYYALNQAERSRLMYLAEVQLGADAVDLPSGLPAQVELP